MVRFRSVSRRGEDRDDRGAVAVLTALSMVVILAGVGLGVDTGNVTMQQRQAQHGADAAALAIATECVLQQTACSPSQNLATAEYFVEQNSPGAEVDQPVIPATGGRVTVRATEDVPTSFMSIAGIDSADVEATATAEWGGYPLYGAAPLPLAIPYCQWLENRPGLSSSPVLLRTDLVGKTVDTLNTNVVTRTLSTLLPAIAPQTASCKTPDGQDIAQMRGPVWMTGILEVLAGIIEFFPAECKLTTDDVNVAVGGVLTSVVPPSCITKLGTSIKPGDIILLPIYMPANNLLNLGLDVKACTGILLLGLKCVSVPPKLGVQIMGYAPFKITGWSFPGNVHTDPSAPSCSPFLTLLGLVSVGCDGITGHFVNTVQKDPDFTYGPGGMNFGANRVELVE